MVEFTQSNFYKALQDFFIDNKKETFLQMLAEFYNRTEGIITRDNIQDELIKELRELYLEFNEKGIDENIVREKVEYFLTNSNKLQNILSQLSSIDNKIENINVNIDNIRNKMKDNVLILDNKYFKNKNHRQAIEEVINNTTATKIIFPKQDYQIDGVITINRNNIELDFSNAIFKWINTQPLSSSNSYLGMLWIKGNVIGDKYNVISYNKSENDKRYGVIKCNSIGSLKVGDFIEVNCDTGEWLKDYTNFRPSVNTIAKIISIDGTEITIDHYCPFDFSVGIFNGTIQKVNVINNVKIKNMKYVDTVPPVDGDNRQSWASGIALNYCNNVLLENIYFENNKYPFIWNYKSRNVKIRDIEGYNSQINGAGNGYAIQNINSNIIIIDNVISENTNVLIDFSGCSYATVRNCKTGDNIGSNFLLHGNCEHDIAYYDCVSSKFSFGSGVTDFRSMFKNIHIENCTMDYLKLERGINVKLINCKGVLEGATLNVNGLTFDKCDFTINLGKYDFVGDMKAWINQFDDSESYLNILNSSFKIYKTVASKKFLMFNKFKHVNINNNIIKSLIPNTSYYVPFIDMRYVNSIKINDNTFYDVSISPSYYNPDSNIIIKGNSFFYTLTNYGGYNFIEFVNNDNTSDRISAIIVDNYFTSLNEGYSNSNSPRAIYVNTTSGRINKNTNNLVVNGNILDRNVISKYDAPKNITLVKSGNLISNNGSNDLGQVFV